MERIRVFLTGATGVMGMAGLRELTCKPEKYKVRVLARPSDRNRKKLHFYESKGVEVVWGDLLDRKVLERGILDSDIVLHVGGMVSPMAEHFPEKTLKVNVGSMKLIGEIVKEIEQHETPREIKVVYIGSVSQYGSHLPPDHWGKRGDRLEAAKFDSYAVSKILAERVLMESGLKKWVSLRQTAILHPGLLTKANDPVTFHVPLDGAIEWITTEDSGRLLERVCDPELNDNFWNKVYNCGGGESFRLTNLEFEKGILKALGCPPPEKIFEPQWFATNNFHGIWFEDSDNLDRILKYRKKDSFEEALKRIRKELPFYYRLTPIAPAFVIKKIMKRVANTPGLGPLWWLKVDDKERIKAAWGSREAHSEISSWKDRKEIKLVKKKEQYSPSETLEETCLRKVTCKRGHTHYTSGVLESAGHGCPYCLFQGAQVVCKDFSLTL